MAQIGSWLAIFLMSLAVGIVFTLLFRLVPPIRRQPAAAYWIGAAFALSVGGITLDRSSETLIVSALAGTVILLRHYLTIKKA